MAGRFSSFGQGLQNRPKHRQTDPFWMSLAQNRAVGLQRPNFPVLVKASRTFQNAVKQARLGRVYVKIDQLASRGLISSSGQGLQNGPKRRREKVGLNRPGGPKTSKTREGLLKQAWRSQNLKDTRRSA